MAKEISGEAIRLANQETMKRQLRVVHEELQKLVQDVLCEKRIDSVSVDIESSPFPLISRDGKKVTLKMRVVVAGGTVEKKLAARLQLVEPTDQLSLTLKSPKKLIVDRVLSGERAYAYTRFVEDGARDVTLATGAVEVNYDYGFQGVGLGTMLLKDHGQKIRSLLAPLAVQITGKRVFISRIEDGTRDYSQGWTKRRMSMFPGYKQSEHDPNIFETKPVVIEE